MQNVEIVYVKIQNIEGGSMRYTVIVAVCFFALFSCGVEEYNVTETNERVVPVDTLVIAMQMGTDYGDSTNTFGMITDAAIDNSGNILVLDRMVADLKMYDSLGGYVRNVTRRGNGPEWEFHPEPLKDMIIYINIGPDGNLWTRRGTTQTLWGGLS